MGKHAQSIDREILARITRKGRGRVFTPVDFLDLGSRDAVDQALSRNARAGTIRKIARGLYDYPRRHPRLGLLSPSTDAIVAAIKTREGVRLQPSGAHAANILGLSDQVPVKTVYFTDGRSRTIRLGKQTILLKKTTPRQMATAGRASGTVIQALRWLGRRNMNEKVVATLRRILSPRDKRHLLDDLRYAPEWVAKVMSRVARSQP